MDAKLFHLKKYINALPVSHVITYCQNNSVNALLNYLIPIARESAVDIRIYINIPEHLPVTDIDLCSILGNVLENAIDGCKTVSSEKRSVQLSVTTRHDSYLYIVSTNTFDGIVKKENISVSTKSGIKYLDLTVRDGKVALVRVNMGSPVLTASQIPVVSSTEEMINAPLKVNGETYYITAVSMGNPHAIVYMTDVDHLDIGEIGPYFENHMAFPDRVNTEFVEVLDDHTLKMRVWERGSGIREGKAECTPSFSS